MFHLTWAMHQHANYPAWPWLFLYSVDENLNILFVEHVRGGGRTEVIWILEQCRFYDSQFKNGVWCHPIYTGKKLKLVVSRNKLYFYVWRSTRCPQIVNTTYIENGTFILNNYEKFIVYTWKGTNKDFLLTWWLWKFYVTYIRCPDDIKAMIKMDLDSDLDSWENSWIDPRVVHHSSTL